MPKSTRLILIIDLLKKDRVFGLFCFVDSYLHFSSVLQIVLCFFQQDPYRKATRLNGIIYFNQNKKSPATAGLRYIQDICYSQISTEHRRKRIRNETMRSIILLWRARTDRPILRGKLALFRGERTILKRLTVLRLNSCPRRFKATRSLP